MFHVVQKVFDKSWTELKYTPFSVKEQEIRNKASFSLSSSASQRK